MPPALTFKRKIGIAEVVTHLFKLGPVYNPRLHFHFTGIGGSGMSGLAEILLAQGFAVSGSDMQDSPVVQRLRSLGATIYLGHATAHVPAACSSLVYSSAIPDSNPELVEAQRRSIPVIRRADILAELMRLKFGVAVAGSHGKTTTTSLCAAILDNAGLDPTVIIGGLVKSIGSGGKLGSGDFLVAESDESDRSFLSLKPTVAIVTNIDLEHLGAYESVADLESSFEQFVSAVPFYGLAILCIDNPRVRELASRYRGRKLTYGVSEDADLRATNFTFEAGCTTFSVLRGEDDLGVIQLAMPGKHIALNSLAAIAVALEFDVPFSVIQQALSSFSGVGRRLELVATVGGISIIDDYGHHPTEIKATLQAVRDAWPHRKIQVLFQPHRYTRTRDSFTDFLTAFDQADRVAIVPIYPAGEAAIEGISAERLVAEMSHPDCCYLTSVDALIPHALQETAGSDDIILCLGAGSVSCVPEKLRSALQNEQSCTQVSHG